MIPKNDFQFITSYGIAFKIIDGARVWLTPPPKGYICTDGTRYWNEKNS